MVETKEYIRFDEVAKHTSENDLWFIKDNKVYDISKFVDQHPGGVDTLLGVAGKDGTADFDAVGHSDSAKEELARYYIGELHPSDLDRVPHGSQQKSNNFFAICVVGLLIAVCAYFIFKPTTTTAAAVPLQAK